MPMSENTPNYEISIIDILRFLKGAYKAILIAGLGGLIIAGVYIYSAQRQYEAVAQISVAQIAVPSNAPSHNFSNLNPLGASVEDPALLIARLSAPTSFTPQVLSSCAPQDKGHAPSSIAKFVKLSIPKGTPNIVELKVYRATPELAKNCAQAIFEFIQVTQAEISSPYIDEAKNRLMEDKIRLQAARDHIANTDKFRLDMSATYLSTKDEIRFLLDEIASLANIVSTNKSRATRLIAPIYVSEVPISPNKSQILAVGLIGGMLLGLLLVFVGNEWSRSKKAIIEVLKNG